MMAETDDPSTSYCNINNGIIDVREVIFGENNIKGVLYIPNKVPAPAIIFCNGKDTSIVEYRYYDYDKWPERRYINPEAICKEGYIVLMVEFRGYDASNGFFTLENAVQDVSDAINFLEERDDVIKDDIGIVGFSLGGSIAMIASAEDDRIKTCIAISPPIDLYDTSINWINNQTNIPKNVKFGLVQSKEYLPLILTPNNPFLICLKPLKVLKAPESCPADLCMISFYIQNIPVLSCNTEGIAISRNPKVSPADLDHLFEGLEEYDVYKYIKAIYPRHVMIVSGTEDRLVSVDDVRMVQEKLLKDSYYKTDKQNIEFLYYDGDHCILDKKTADNIIKYLNDNLKNF